jgi:hypothetical protein
MNDKKTVFLNKPQHLVMLIRAFITVLIWGRGTGKSSGAISFQMLHLMEQMPRGKTLIVCPTYIHALTNTLPPVIEMFNRLGYEEDVDYWVGKRPPKAKFPNWEGPHSPPLNYKHAICFPNGHVAVLISQDRVSNAAGISGDAMIIDEAKHINFDKLQETFQTLRGNKNFFGHLSCYRSIFIATDMPTSPKSKWIFEYEKLMDEIALNLVLGIQYEIIKLRKEAEGASNTVRKEISRKIYLYEKSLNEIRKGNPDKEIEPLVFFSEFSTLENMAVLGEEYIKAQKRSLPPTKFRTSILNKRESKIEGGFYPIFDEDLHTYYAFKNIGITNNLSRDLKNKALKSYENDADVQPDDILYIAMDYNNKINSLSVGVDRGDKFDTVNFFYVETPLVLPDVVQKFCDYYQNHPNKHVVYYYDHTAIYKDASRDYSFADEVIQRLADNDWNVSDEYIGQAPAHNKKYFFIAMGMKKERGLPYPRFNRYNADSLITSIELAGARNGRNGFEKDKRPENDPNIPPVETTHPCDSWDTLYFGFSRDRVDNMDDGFYDTSMM